MNYELIEREITTAILSGQRRIKIENIEFERLPILKRDTTDRKEIQAKQEAKKIIEVLKS